MNLKHILTGRLNRLVTRSPNKKAEQEILHLIQSGDHKTWHKKYRDTKGNTPLRNGETILTQMLKAMKQAQHNYTQAWKLYKKTSPLWDYLHQNITAAKNEHILFANADFLRQLNIPRQEWPDRTFDKADVERMKNDGVSVKHDKNVYDGLNEIFNMTVKNLEIATDFKPNAKGQRPVDMCNTCHNVHQPDDMDSQIDSIDGVLATTLQVIDRKLDAQTFLRWKNDPTNQSNFSWLKKYAPSSAEFQSQFGLALADKKFADAIRSGDLITYKKMVAAPFITQAIFNDGETPLIMAMKIGTEKAMHEQLMLRSFIKNRDIQSGNIEAITQWHENYLSTQKNYGDIDQICDLMMQEIAPENISALPENSDNENAADIFHTHKMFNENILEYRKTVFSFIDTVMAGEKPESTDTESSAGYVPEMDYSRSFYNENANHLSDKQRKEDLEKRKKDKEAQRQYDLWMQMLENQKFHDMHQNYRRKVLKQELRKELDNDRKQLEKSHHLGRDRGYEMDR